jgi:outer membrane protein assembly factor BamB
MRRELAWLATAMGLFVSTAAADDWPQWMGPRRDGVWSETGIVSSVPDTGLPVKWRTPIALGYSGPAVAGGRVYVTDYVLEQGDPVNNPGSRPKLNGQERVVCLDAESGDVVWTHAYNQPYEISYPGGPRTTPTVEGERVYALGAEGKLLCLDAGSGDVVWSKDFKADYGAATPLWGHSAHPLIDGGRLVCLVGGKGTAVVAFNKATGEEVWRALSAEGVGYCPPALFGAGSAAQLLIWLPDAAHGLEPATGAALWSIPLKPDFGMSIAAPQFAGNKVFLSGVGNHSVLLTVGSDRKSVKEEWRGTGSTSIACSHSTPIIDDGVIYGCDDKGWLRAVDLATGERLWSTLEATTGARPAGYGTAFLVKQGDGDRYWLFNDQGDLILAALNRAGYKELGRMHVLEPTNEAFGRPVVWSHPAFANGCVFARNDKEVVCVSLSGE